MLKTYQFKTHCKGDSHSSKTANIILPGLVIKQACAANRRYSMRRRKCKQNKRYRTSARMTLAYNKSTSGHGTDGQTYRVQRNMRHPPTEEGAA